MRAAAPHVCAPPPPCTACKLPATYRLCRFPIIIPVHAAMSPLSMPCVAVAEHHHDRTRRAAGPQQRCTCQTQPQHAAHQQDRRRRNKGPTTRRRMVEQQHQQAQRSVSRPSNTGHQPHHRRVFPGILRGCCCRPSCAGRGPSRARTADRQQQRRPCTRRRARSTNPRTHTPARPWIGGRARVRAAAPHVCARLPVHRL